MPLLAGDIRFARSASMADVAEGGGPPSAELLTSGRSNDIFPDISEESRTTGRVEIYQIFSVLRNPDRAALLGANAIIGEPPADPNVSVTMLSLGTPFATRADIAKRIESGMAQGSEFSGYLLEDHFTTMRTIQIFQRPGSEPPAIGRTYILVYNEGASTERRQRIRIRDVDVTTRTFTVNVGGSAVDIQAQVCSCELFDILAYDFPGSPPSRFYARETSKSMIRETNYSDAGLFYSASRLAEPCAATDSTIRVNSVYTQVVPNSRSEAASVDQRPAAQKTLVLAENPRRVEVGVTPHTQRIMVAEENAGQTFVTQLRPLPAPGLLHIDYYSMGNRYTITDDGNGRLTGNGGGAVSYTSGAVQITLNAVPDINSSIAISWGEGQGFTNRAGSIASARAPEWGWQLDTATGTARIVPGTLTLQWEAGGAVKTATDNGSGALTGDATGTVDYFSRSIFFRPNVLPDSGAEVFATCKTVEAREELLGIGGVDAGGFAMFDLAERPAAGSVMVEWATVNSVSRSSGGSVSTSRTLKSSRDSTSSGSGGGGSSSGTNFATRVLYSSGSSSGSGLAVAWAKPTTSSSSSGNQQYVSISSDSSGSNYSTSSGTTESGQVVQWHAVTDDGAGGLGVFGHVDYDAGRIQLRLQDRATSTASYNSDYEEASAFEKSVQQSQASGSGSSSSSTGSGRVNTRNGGQYSTTSVERGVLAGSSVRVTYSVGTAAQQNHSSSFALGEMALDIAPLTAEAVVPGSVQFLWAGATYQDDDGVIYQGRTDSNPGSASGFIDYAMGVVTMTQWTGGGAAAAPRIDSLFTRKSEWSTACLFFNTAQAPLRAGAGGFVLSVLDTSGDTITANVDAQGNITGQHMRGHIDFARGGVQLQFGDYVNDSSLTAEEKSEWWYDAADVGAVEPGKIWKPWPVDPASLRYSCVSFVYLPVDVSLMGIDPAALPSDGRVTFARPGDTCVIGRNIMGDPFAPSAGMTYNVGTPRLSMIQVLNAETGEEILDGHTCNLDAGSITITDPVGWPASVRVFARQEVYRQISDVKIDGRVTLTQPVGVAFDAGAVFSTALRQGDRFARVKRVYDQQSWNGTSWVDGLSGNQAAANYDTTNHPIAVTNLGAITERWALRFRSNAQDFDLIGQNLGQIASGNINADFSPQNHAAGAPYFTIKAAGWGAGWQAGNVLFIDTVGAEAAIDLVRCVQPSSPAGVDDSVLIVQRGDVDRPPATSFPG